MSELRSIVPEDRVSRYVDEYSRDELGTAAKALREDADEFNLQTNRSKHDRAEFIASFDEKTAAAALGTATESAEDEGSGSDEDSSEEDES